MRVRLMIDIESPWTETLSQKVVDQAVVHLRFIDDNGDAGAIVGGRLVGAEEAYDSLIELKTYERDGA